jgi:hypothetical protein
MNNFFTLYNGNIEVFIQDDESSEFYSVLKKLEKIIPEYFFMQGIDVIYLGEFSDLRERHLNAAYADGAIYVIPNYADKEDVLDDIVHEVAHSLEERFTDFIYEDNEIKTEFRKKYGKLIEILIKQTDIKVHKDFIYEVPYDYSERWDKFLHQEVGYDALHILTAGLFCSPYGATSLREYWANCFEHYFLTNDQELAKIAPNVFEKIKELDDRAKTT